MPFSIREDFNLRLEVGGLTLTPLLAAKAEATALFLDGGRVSFWLVLENKGNFDG